MIHCYNIIIKGVVIMNSFERDLANKFTSESVPIEESELITVNDYDDFITFTVVSRFHSFNY